MQASKKFHKVAAMQKEWRKCVNIAIRHRNFIPEYCVGSSQGLHTICEVLLACVALASTPGSQWINILARCCGAESLVAFLVCPKKKKENDNQTVRHTEIASTLSNTRWRFYWFLRWSHKVCYLSSVTHTSEHTEYLGCCECTQLQLFEWSSLILKWCQWCRRLLCAAYAEQQRTNPAEAGVQICDAAAPILCNAYSALVFGNCVCMWVNASVIMRLLSFSVCIHKNDPKRCPFVLSTTHL